jgi:hypothetical protein
MRRILTAAALTGLALGAAPHPCQADEALMGVGPDAAPAPTRIRIERHLSVVANVVRYVEDHLGVEVVPGSLGHLGGPGSPLGLGEPAVAGTFALGGAGDGTRSPFGPLSAAISAGQDRVRLTLRMRW